MIKPSLGLALVRARSASPVRGAPGAGLLLSVRQSVSASLAGLECWGRMGRSLPLHASGYQMSLLTLLSLLQIEMAILRFPYESWGTPFQQLKQVVEEPSPQLPADQFSPEFVDFTSQW